MSRINTNIPSMVAARILEGQNNRLNTSLHRLATGLRINSGKDDPAGLIASEALRAERAAIGAAITNVSRATNIVSVAEGGLVEISKLLTELEDLIDRSANEAGISVDERNANQLQIDAILASINRIANSTEFQGRKLISGELAYTTSGVTGNANLDNVAINGAKVPSDGYRTVVVEVTGSAQLAQLNYSGGTITGPSVTIEIAGNLGTESLTFGSGTAIAAMQTAVNQSTEVTGVSATTSGTTLMFNSIEYGSSRFVSVRAVDGTFTVAGGDAGDDKDFGDDATVRINGTTAITDGLTASARNTSLSADIDLSAAFGTAIGSTTFYVTGGGADFMISPTVSMGGLESLGIQAVSTGSLGKTSIGYLSSVATGQTNALSTGNYATAQRVLRESQDQVSMLRGRLGAFQKDTLETTANSLQITLENTTAAEAAIRDTDFATETSSLTRAQILVQSATQVLRMANAAPQNVLALLG
ncbi:MAG TPA: flagellin [Phycisphaerae bacterium]|nr:flagellin [Phycisphaerae bacterium]